MAMKFKIFYIKHIYRGKNAHADALTSLATFLDLPTGATEKVLIFPQDLYYPKKALGDYSILSEGLQSTDVLETSASLEIRD